MFEGPLDPEAHAAIARDQARADAARGDRDAETLHLGEARAHEGAAQVTEQTAALYRNRARHLTGKRRPEEPSGADR